MKHKITTPKEANEAMRAEQSRMVKFTRFAVAAWESGLSAFDAFVETVDRHRTTVRMSYGFTSFMHLTVEDFYPVFIKWLKQRSEGKIDEKVIAYARMLESEYKDLHSLTCVADLFLDYDVTHSFPIKLIDEATGKTPALDAWLSQRLRLPTLIPPNDFSAVNGKGRRFKITIQEVKGTDNSPLGSRVDTAEIERLIEDSPRVVIDNDFEASRKGARKTSTSKPKSSGNPIPPKGEYTLKSNVRVTKGRVEQVRDAIFEDGPKKHHQLLTSGKLSDDHLAELYRRAVSGERQLSYIRKRIEK